MQYTKLALALLATSAFAAYATKENSTGEPPVAHVDSAAKPPVAPVDTTAKASKEQFPEEKAAAAAAEKEKVDKAAADKAEVHKKLAQSIVDVVKDKTWAEVAKTGS